MKLIIKFDYDKQTSIDIPLSDVRVVDELKFRKKFKKAFEKIGIDLWDCYLETKEDA